MLRKCYQNFDLKSYLIKELQNWFRRRKETMILFNEFIFLKTNFFQSFDLVHEEPSQVF